MSVWEEVKERVQIEEVIGEYVPMYAAGRNFKCLSPFRQERTPSLIISPDKKIWHDFGSGDGGDVFEFVARMENISRYEALKKLAQKVGVNIKPSGEKDFDQESGVGQSQLTTKFDRGLSLLQWTAGVYHKILLKALQTRSNPITEYCLERGLTQEIVQVFGLGYAPKGSFLIGLARQHSVDLNMLYEAGLLRKTEEENSTTTQSAQYKDKFSDRLMIPVKDLSGRVAGFTGRVLPYDKVDRPKYLNSPQTEWFNKSRIWYGWDLNRKHLVQRRAALIVEGNMDVIAAYRHGLNFALASQGTSFTTEQLRVLKSYANTLWLAFDNDEAGRIAGRKLFVEATRMGFGAKKVVIPEQFKDLDEYLADLVKGLGPDQIGESLEVVGYIDWEIGQKSRLLSSDDLDKQRAATIELLELVALTDDLTVEQYAAILAKLTGFGKEKLVREVEKIRQASAARPPRTYSEEPKETELETKNAYGDVLQTWQVLVTYYLFYPEAGLAEEFVVNAFDLLKEFVSALQSYESFGQYVEQNKPSFELIWETKEPEASQNYANTLTKSLQMFLDTKVETFVLDSRKYELYLRVKGI